MDGAQWYSRPQFSEDERVFIFLSIKTGYVLETIRRFKKAVPESEDTVQTNKKRQLQ